MVHRSIFLYSFFFLLTSFSAVCQTFTSVQSGNWEDGATWGNTSPGTNGVDYPTTNQDVVISSGHVVSHANLERPMLLEIQSSAELISNAEIRIRGKYVINGVHSGANIIRLQQNNNDTIQGTGSILTTKTMRIDSKKRVVSGSDITRTGGNIRCPNNDTLFIDGTFRMTNRNIAGNSTSTLFLESNGTLYASRTVINNGTLVASEPGNTVVYFRTGGGNQNIKKTLDGYYNLEITGNNINSDKRILSDETILNDLTITASTFMITDTFNVSIGGDFIKTGGDFINSNGKIIMNGSGSQFIQGEFTFNRLDIENSGAGVTLLSDTSSITGKLMVNSGTLNTQGLLRIVSDINGDASIGPLTGSINGNVLVERYIAAGATNWRFLSSPISDATLADWNDDFITSGFPGSNAPSFDFVSILRYDETVPGHQDSGLIEPTSVSDAIVTTAGYWVYCGDAKTGTSAFTIDMVGGVNSGNIDYPVTYTTSTGGTDADGWNLVSNPYPSAIDWDSPDWDKFDINDAVYIWNADLNQYSSYVGGVGTNNGSNVIAMGQAFYVKATAASCSLSIYETCKYDTSTAEFLRPSIIPTIRLSLRSNDLIDESIIRFRSEATTGFDQNLDAYSLKSLSNDVSISSVSEGIKYSINNQPKLQGDTIKLQMTSESENAKLTIVPENISSDFCLAIWNKTSDELITLNETYTTLLTVSTNDDYRLLYSLKDGSSDPVCFPNGISEMETDDVEIVQENRTVYFSNPDHIGKAYTLHDIQGKVVSRGSTQQSLYLGSQHSAGVYFLHVENTKPFKIVLI